MLPAPDAASSLASCFAFKQSRPGAVICAGRLPEAAKAAQTSAVSSDSEDTDSSRDEPEKTIRRVVVATPGRPGTLVTSSAPRNPPASAFATVSPTAKVALDSAKVSAGRQLQPRGFSAPWQEEEERDLEAESQESRESLIRKSHARLQQGDAQHGGTPGNATAPCRASTAFASVDCQGSTGRSGPTAAATGRGAGRGASLWTAPLAADCVLCSSAASCAPGDCFCLICKSRMNMLESGAPARSNLDGSVSTPANPPRLGASASGSSLTSLASCSSLAESWLAPLPSPVPEAVASCLLCGGRFPCSVTDAQGGSVLCGRCMVSGRGGGP